MNRRDLTVGIIVIALIIGGYMLFKKAKNPPVSPPITPSVQETIEKTFNVNIPKDVDTAEMKDVSGGNGSGLATRKWQNGKFTHTILADLPEPPKGEYYEGWLSKDDQFVSTGKLRVAKGGYLLEFNSSKNYSDYPKVAVTLEKINDQKPETRILEGSF